jgi:purine-binding chemotaxis protein CheW
MSNEDFDLDDDDDDDNLENTYLTFSIAGEDYALHVANVIEIVRLERIYAVPDVESHIRGVMNLRGKVIPLLDVRARFGLPHAEYTDRTVVVVIHIGDAPTGLVVDGVFDIAEIAPQQIEPAPTAMASGSAALVTGMGKRDGRVSFIVDAATLVAPIRSKGDAPLTPPSRVHA